MVDENVIEISATPRKGIPVMLVGEKYTVRAPKGALGLRMSVAAQKADKDPAAMEKAMGTFIDTLFGKKEGSKVHKRLEDPEDDLDYDHIMDLVTQVMEQVTGNPTTSSSD